MAVLEFLMNALEGYPYLVAFLGGAFFGEETIFILTILAIQGFFPIWVIFIFAYFGTIVIDSLLFFIGRMKIFNKFKKFKFAHRNYKRAGKIIDKYSEKNLHKVIFIIKTIYGVGIFTLLHLGRSRKIPFKKFFLVNLIVTFFWMSLVVAVGLLAGQGYTFILIVFKNVQMAISFIVILVICFYLVHQWFKEKLSGS
jgi:membrane protein DedA with SNARE-associated domain